MSVDEELGPGLSAASRLPSADDSGGPSPGQQPVQRLPGRRRIWKPASATGITSLSITTSGTATCRAPPILVDITVQRTDGEGARAADEARLPLCAEPRDRASRSGRSWKDGAQGRCAGRMVFADPADPDQAAGLRSAGRVDRRPHRLHAGAAGRSRQDGVAVQARADLHAAGRQQGRWPARQRWRWPNSSGGANWPGGSYDPETHTALRVLPSHTVWALSLVPSDGNDRDMRYVAGAARRSGRRRRRAARSVRQAAAVNGGPPA